MMAKGHITGRITELEEEERRRWCGWKTVMEVGRRREEHVFGR